MTPVSIPKVRLYLERPPFVVKTVESSWELEAAQRLRARVFFEELQGHPASGALDQDDFDSLSDHLIIVDQRSGDCVGTYRLIASNFSDRFYASGEFDIADLLALPGHKLELGRACIDRAYRTGSVIALLWAGIAQYLQKVDARYLFGCASVHTLDPIEIAVNQKRLRERGHVAQDLALDPLPGWRLQDHGLEVPGDAFDSAEAAGRIPPLLLSYLRMGARVSRQPAVDREFHCVDFLTVLDTARLSASYERRFIRSEA